MLLWRFVERGTTFARQANVMGLGFISSKLFEGADQETETKADQEMETARARTWRGPRNCLWNLKVFIRHTTCGSYATRVGINLHLIKMHAPSHRSSRALSSSLSLFRAPAWRKTPAQRRSLRSLSGAAQSCCRSKHLSGSVVLS